MTVIKNIFVIYWARKREVGNTCYNPIVGNTPNFQIKIDFQAETKLSSTHCWKGQLYLVKAALTCICIGLIN